MTAANLHVVGCPRSGTTLMAEMLTACYRHSEHSGHERSIFNLRPPRGLHLSKQPNDVLWLEPLLERDPRLFVIAVLRDPRSVVCSVHAEWPDMYFCNYPVWKRAERAIARIESFSGVLLVHYEELVRDPMNVQETIEDQFPFLQRRHDFERFHDVARADREALAALGGLRKPEAGRIANWKQHLPRVKQQMLQYPGLKQDLIHHGYEQKNDWTAILDDVPAETFPCRYADSPRFLQRLEQRLRFTAKRRRYFRKRGL